MGRPASHKTHFYFCGIHGGPDGQLSEGSGQTLVVGMDAGRMGDKCTCTVGGHAAFVSSGAAQVLIDGAPAVRTVDSTVDKGVLVGGETSVLIGGAQVSLPPNLKIEGDEAYRAKVMRHLALIAGTPSGQKMFASIGASKNTVYLSYCKPNENSTTTHPHPLDRERRAQRPPGSDVKVCYDPDKAWHYGGHKRPPNQRDAPRWSKPPGWSPDVALFHELVHADDAVNGKAYPSHRAHEMESDAGRGLADRAELRATGIPWNEGAAGRSGAGPPWPYSENSYRNDRGLPRRTYYD